MKHCCFNIKFKFTAPESLPLRTSPRGSIAGDYYDRSPRGSIGPEFTNKSPRGSLVRNNLLGDDIDRRSPRGSLTLTFQEPLTTERRHSTDNSAIYNNSKKKTNRTIDN